MLITGKLVCLIAAHSGRKCYFLCEVLGQFILASNTQQVNCKWIDVLVDSKFDRSFLLFYILRKQF